MGQQTGESSVARLRHQAEVALRRSGNRSELEPLLERLEGAAEEGSEPWLFAHRHLAELRLEAHPWRAALHLRHVLKVQDDDDVVHALMGLCHALLGNYRAAVGAYRRALGLAPQNPWYHHNLGHLLDVALGKPEQAAPHLQSAHRMEPDEDEITASLAHCLARLGRVEDARELGDEALRLAPDNEEHRALFDWIDHGAPTEASRSASAKERRRTAAGSSTNDRPSGRSRGAEGTSMPRSSEDRAVAQALERGMREGGFSVGQLDRALALWSDFHQGRRVKVVKPEVYAAAVEYAIALVHGIGGITKAAVARRYGVAPTSLSTRYGEIRDALSLEPGDPRYAEST